MSLRRFVALLFIGAALVSLAACGGSGGASGGSSGGSAALALEAQDIKWDKNTLNVNSGQDVTITVNNKGQLQHDLVVGLPSGEITTNPIDAGKTGKISFKAPAAGTYDYWCTIPGHKEAGMVGKLVVK
ncbi:MAG: cupredoxin domain-containing protein [Chloroflexi bacterium]|nr:cupredoxin domain-containing protein [Chloroflexota bacterium]